MDNVLKDLEPERLWYYFIEILQIPRPSKKEDKIAEYVLKFGKNLNLETVQDEVGNIVIRKPATIGREKVKMVALQSHLDMVGEKNSDVNHDFDKDPIEAYVENGWVKAKGTTLGADDGIGIAAQLAILEATDINHGPIECLFTADEETGMTGAFGLQTGFLKSSILLNLDSEDEGELFIGCAGGRDTSACMNYSQVPVNSDSAYEIRVTGLKGGHSGDDIHKGRGNANKILNRLLWITTKKYETRISSFNGGNLRNAIAREAKAVVTVPKRFQKEFTDYIDEFNLIVKTEYKHTEPDLKVRYHSADVPSSLIDISTQEKLLNALYACPHGVYAWSASIPNFVETSTNLAAVKTEDNKIHITTSQRSSVESAKDDICNKVTSVFNLAGAKVVQTDGYPGWTPNPNSEILELTREAYERNFNQKPKVLAIHAGLECGLIGEKYPGMDMISYGPTIKGAHSPDEALEIETVKKFWKLTIDVLDKIPGE